MHRARAPVRAVELNPTLNELRPELPAGLPPKLPLSTGHQGTARNATGHDVVDLVVVLAPIQPRDAEAALIGQRADAMA
jgi:hypothetical protein